MNRNERRFAAIDASISTDEAQKAFRLLANNFADASKAMSMFKETVTEWKRIHHKGNAPTFVEFMERKLKAQPIRPLALAVAIRRVNHAC